jgi:hypothetical protein
MAESIQRILAWRARAAQSPTSPEQIIQQLEAVAAHWNRAPTPLSEVASAPLAVHERTSAVMPSLALAPVLAILFRVVRPNCINGYVHDK